MKLHFCCCVGLSILLVAVAPSIGQESSPDEVYSGPQPGEKLAPFKMKQVYGADEGKELDLIEAAGGNPVVIIFVHERSRPAFGLANLVARYCNDEKDKLTRGICFLTDDPTETQTWLSRIQNYFPRGTPIGISTDGLAGPGAYGLNRNVALTILVGKDNKTTANFALVQPSTAQDGPKILKAIAKTIGAKKDPDINQYMNRQSGDARPRVNPELGKLVRQLFSDTSDEAAAKTIESINQLIKDKPGLERQLGQLAQNLSGSTRMERMQNEAAKKQIAVWAKKFQQPPARQNRADAKLTGMLRSLIQKSNSDEQVDKIAAEIEKYVSRNDKARAEIARISRTIAGSDRLPNYGTARAQEVLKRWNKKYNQQDRDDDKQ